jgi:hypothetical protein
MSDAPELRFERPIPARDGPNREAGNFYRSATGPASDAIGGVPLTSVQAAVVSAVRMGYKIAAAQVDRTERFAKRMSQAGDQAAGPESERQALDATEELVFKALMSGLTFLEGAAADRANPIMRLAKAQYQLLGTLLGLTPARDRDAGPDEKRPPAPARETPVDRARTRARLQIRHRGAERRAVRVREFDLAADAAPGEYPVTFYADERASGTIAGIVTVRRDSGPTLTLTSPEPAGSWTAPICDDDGIQIGYIEIEL